MSSELEDQIRRVLANRANAVTADRLQPAVPPTAAVAPAPPRRLLLLVAAATAAAAVIATVVLLIRPPATRDFPPADLPPAPGMSPSASGTSASPEPDTTGVPSASGTPPPAPSTSAAGIGFIVPSPGFTVITSDTASPRPRITTESPARRSGRGGP